MWKRLLEALLRLKLSSSAEKNQPPECLVVTIGGEIQELSSTNTHSLIQALEKIQKVSLRRKGAFDDPREVSFSIVGIGEGVTTPEKIRAEVLNSYRMSLVVNKEMAADYEKSYLLLQDVYRRYPDMTLLCNQEILKNTSYYSARGGQTPLSTIIAILPNQEFIEKNLDDLAAHRWYEQIDICNRYLELWERISTEFTQQGFSSSDAERAMNEAIWEGLRTEKNEPDDRKTTEQALDWHRRSTTSQQAIPSEPKKDALSEAFGGMVFKTNAKEDRFCLVYVTSAELNDLKKALDALLIFHRSMMDDDWQPPPEKKLFHPISVSRKQLEGHLAFNWAQAWVLTHAIDSAKQLNPRPEKLEDSMKVLAEFGAQQIERSRNRSSRGV